jgi:diadenosine tetraphosphate (Ap4A) HIT family hydrolase
MHPHIAALMTLVCLVLLSHPCDAIAQGRLCTKIPDLYGNWKRLTPWTDMSDDSLRFSVAPERLRISGMPDPLTPLATMDSAQRAFNKERVLWEDNRVMVIVAKGETPLHLLVVPKNTFMFIIDVPQSERDRLALVAAATSDAMMQVAGKKCDGTPPSAIYIHPPALLGVRQLHVHVVPNEPDTTKNLARVYSEVGQRVDSLLKPAPSR